MMKKGLFDPEAYLAANPDVAAAGEDPFRHYIVHGMDEERKLGGSANAIIENWKEEDR